MTHPNSTHHNETSTVRTEQQATAEEQTACDLCERENTVSRLLEIPDEEPRVHRIWVIPPEYDHVCTGCAEQANEFTVADMTDAELIAAVVSDSLGYASPGHAAQHVARYRDSDRENTVHCERGSAQFDNDLEKMMERARHHWVTLSEDKRENLLEKVAEWEDLEAEHGTTASMTVSMFAPTMLS